MKPILLTILTLLTLLVFQYSCTHDPFVVDDFEPDPNDTMAVDTFVMGVPCDPDIVYFQNDILSILTGSCAFSGCHDAATATEGVILDSYDNVINTADVKAFDLDDSELYEVITETDPDKVMPPTGKLDNEQINLIAQWILQGAENLKCDEEQVDCITENTTYSGFVKGVFNTTCNGCHSSNSAFGGIILDSYQEVKNVVDAGRLYGAINWEVGYSAMPQNQSKLDSCTIAKVKSWIDEGAQNN
jgi:mono/diheme cytochrome c family protein